MATHSQITNLIQSAIALYLAGDMDNERWEFEHNRDDDFSFVDCDVSPYVAHISNREFGLVVDGQVFIVTVKKPRGE